MGMMNHPLILPFFHDIPSHFDDEIKNESISIGGLWIALAGTTAQQAVDRLVSCFCQEL